MRSFLIRCVLLGCTLAGSVGCAISAEPDQPGAVTESERLSALFDDIVHWDKQRSPLAELYEGRHAEAIREVAAADFRRHGVEAQSFLGQLQGIDQSQLTHQQRVSSRIMGFRLKDIVDRVRFGAYLVPINAEGGFYSSLGFALRRLPFDTEADYDAYARWLGSYGDYLRSHIALLEEGRAAGRVAPRVVVENTLAMLKPLATSAPEQHVAAQPLHSMPSSWSGATQQRVKAAIRDVVAEHIQPAYQALHDYFATVYLESATQQPGLVAQPNGREYYANRVKFFTTMQLTPAEVFELGVREVERIEGAMAAVLQELDYEGDRQSFIEFLRTDKAQYPTSAQALLERAAWLSKKIEGRLPQYFSPLYELPFTVAPVPELIAPTYTSGRYVSGDPDARRPGIYWVNTSRLNSRALYNLPALTLHEAVPGHHLQHARAAELDGVHPFRKEYYISAFGEGWGLYAEFLGEEMGIYETAYERFGRLSYEMWRACRLVVDVGLHDRGWSRQRAMDYLGQRSALSEHEVRTEIDRYIGWPGQALAYKLGELTIKGLRVEAERELGENFDVRQFHEAVLGNGSLPLEILVSEVRRQLSLQNEGSPIDFLGR